MFKVNPYSIALELENIIVSLNTFSLTSDGPPNLLMVVRYSYFRFDVRVDLCMPLEEARPRP